MTHLRPNRINNRRQREDVPNGRGQEVGNEQFGDGKSLGETFSKLYDQYMPKVFQYISYRVNDVALVEDLTSAVFEKALTNFQNFRSEKASFPTWLFCIAQRVLIDHFRVNNKRQAVTLEKAGEIVWDNLSPEDEAIQKDDIKGLHQRLGKLSLQEQEIISMKFGVEMTNREIAKTLGLSESNVGTILYRAICKLRDGYQR